jgi:hypothetical protein
MSFNSQAIKAFLKKGEIKKLFIEGLGWDAGQAAKDCEVQGTTYSLKVVASKAGFKVWHCELPGQSLPSRDEMKTVHRQLVKESYEHIIIFSSKDSKSQAWLWVRREANKPISYKHHLFNISQDGESLTQKLRALYITFEEEESGVNIVDVTKRAKTAFDVEKVTKKFYQEFDKHRKVFLGFIDGIPVESDREWYASVMLNRLMFAYFIQKKGFLDSNPDYLKSKLKECQAKKGEDQFYSFYRIFLLRLFHEGLGMKKLNRPKGLEALLGNIPYLNGGMFDVHELEHPDRYGKTIEIKDEAFERVFAYFDEYQWHLDDRPLKNDKEINPDVLGYIFEKYINQKQMGAYYTKEDITGYISKSTIIPFIFDSARARNPGSFDSENSPVWSILRRSPDEFISQELRHGVEIVLPANIDEGVDCVTPGLLNRRSGWNRPASDGYALPTETWREVIERRKRYSQIREQLSSGSIRSIDKLVTLNLDLRQFALEVIDSCDDPDLLWALWEGISKISILDPTGGSGAFLFAALSVLESLYGASLERMDELIAKGAAQSRSSDFSKVINEAEKHANRKYYILKSIILNNLYAVDIMEEAVEICKLRLFLKLASQVEPDVSKENMGIEPLPDVDFNICAGNALVGFATYNEVKVKFSSGLDFEDAMGSVSLKAQELQRAADLFRGGQTMAGATSGLNLKIDLQNRLSALEEELNGYLASDYGVKKLDREEYAKWVKSHQPFHWFIRFYGIMSSGGFDVVIGNPPYIEYAKVKKSYQVRGLATEECGNLYAYVMEKAGALTSRDGRFGMIIPLSICSSERMKPLRQWLSSSLPGCHISNFEIFPSKLFDGAFQRLSIVLGSRSPKDGSYISKLHRWYTAERGHLIPLISYSSVIRNLKSDLLMKIQGSQNAQILELLMESSGALEQWCSLMATNHFVFYQEATNYWAKAVSRIPYCKKNGLVTRPAHSRVFYLNDAATASIAMACVNSSLFYLWYISLSDGFHMNDSIVKQFPVTEGMLSDPRLRSLAQKLEKDIKNNSFVTTRNTDADKIEIEAFKMVASKPIIDEIDMALGAHYGLDEELMDYVINFDAKYRLGKIDE